MIATINSSLSHGFGGGMLTKRPSALEALPLPIDTVPRGIHGLQLVGDRTKMAPGAEEALERAMQPLEGELRK